MQIRASPRNDLAPQLSVESGHCSLAGKREQNEDFVGMVTPVGPELEAKGLLAAIADGVSGHGGGREAAEYTVRGLLSDYYATPDRWEIPMALDKVLNAINRWLLAQASAHPEKEGMATTLSALVLRGCRYTFAHIGDTRIYLLRRGRLTRLTTDHVWNRPDMHHVLTRAVGLDARVTLDYGDGELEIGDRFILLCDGVWQTLGDATLMGLLNQHADTNDAAQALCNAALTKGSQDNVSALIVNVQSLPEADLEDTTAAAMALQPPHRLQVGDKIDGFDVLEILHDSRATLLYKVRDSITGNIYAMKTLAPDFGDDAMEQAAFLHEEWLAKRVVARFFPQHVAVAQERRSYLYFLMTWHAGATLQQKLDIGAHFTVPDMLLHAGKLVRGVAALHRREILHRDIKPDNIHLGEDGELRILDLGVALSKQEPKENTRMQAGTPSYIAPEQYGGAAPSQQMDVYAAGVTLYHTLTRKYPYGEIEPFQRPKFSEPTPPTRYRPDIPPWFENVILKAVARDPKNRFESADELLVALERGAARPLNAPRPMPLIERDPASLWRAIAAIAIIANILLLYLLIAK